MQPFSVVKAPLMTLTYRPAFPHDAQRCIEIRGLTRENAFSAADLEAIGITAPGWAEGIRTDATPGFVCCQGDSIVGYCFADRNSGEILVLAVLPDWEGRGIGKALLQKTVDRLTADGKQRVFLGCSADPQTRSYGFYRSLGWIPTGESDTNGDDILELFPTPERP